MPELNDKENATLEYIKAYKKDYGIPPSCREISTHVNRSPSNVTRYLDALHRKGYIKRYPGMSRGIKVLEAS